jgi:predicted RNase H-like nuclease (RuvC/YqgF family)
VTVGRLAKRWVKAGKPDIEFPETELGLFVLDGERLEAKIAELNAAWQVEHRLRNEIQGEYEQEVKAKRVLEKERKKFLTVQESYEYFSTQNGQLQIEVARLKGEIGKLKARLEGAQIEVEVQEKAMVQSIQRITELERELCGWKNRTLRQRLADVFRNKGVL